MSVKAVTHCRQQCIHFQQPENKGQCHPGALWVRRNPETQQVIILKHLHILQHQMWLPLRLDKKTNKKNKNKTVTYAKISPNTLNPRDTAGNAEEEEDNIYICTIKVVEAVVAAVVAAAAAVAAATEAAVAAAAAATVMMIVRTTTIMMMVIAVMLITITNTLMMIMIMTVMMMMIMAN